MKKYYTYTVKKSVTVNNLVTLEYLNLTPDFKYPEEVHTFYEFAYVDNGRLTCCTENESITLKQNDFFLIPPNVKHNYCVKNDFNTSVFIVCFNSKSSIIETIKGLTTLDKYEKSLLSKIFTEAKNAFRFPYNKKLVLLDNPVFGAQQLIENTIEEVLINLVRKKIDDNSEIKIIMNSTELENNLVLDILSILKDNVYGKITLEDICKKTYYSKTYLNNIFKKQLNKSIMQYYAQLKIDESKKLLKDGIPITEISDKLYFDTPNYFSKVFKKHTNHTPSQFKENI